MSRYTEFQFCDFESNYDMDELIGGRSPVLDRKEERQTSPGVDESLDLESFHMKSTSNINFDYEISFQNNFMEEHRTVVISKIKNFMELIRQYTKKQHSQLFKKATNNMFDRWTEITIDDSLETQCAQIKNQNDKNILESFSQYNKLMDFMKSIAKYMPEQIYSNLFKWSVLIMKIYKQVCDSYTTPHQFVELANKTAEQISDHEFLNLFFVEQQQTQQTDFIDLKKEFSTFLTSFFATVMLVAAQYFENPYYGQSGGDNVFKRTLNPSWTNSQDEEQDYELTPQKKRKFSF